MTKIKAFMNDTLSYKRHGWQSKERWRWFIETGKNHMPSCQTFWELYNLVFPGLWWSCLKREEGYLAKKRSLNMCFGHLVYRKYTWENMLLRKVTFLSFQIGSPRLEVPTTIQVTYGFRTHPISSVYAILLKIFFAVTQTANIRRNHSYRRVRIYNILFLH